MATDVFNNPREEEPLDIALFQGERRKIIQPTSLLDPKVEKLKDVLVSWINKTLKPDHIVVQSLDEDLFDGLVLHHLLARLAGVSLSVEEIAVTAAAQIHKLGVVLEEANKRLGIRDDAPAKWDVKRLNSNVEEAMGHKDPGVVDGGVIHNKDLLATLHLLVTMVRCFQPELVLPPNIKVEVVLMEVNKTGIKSDIQSEYLTEGSHPSTDSLNSSSGEDPIEKLLTLDNHKILTAKTAILNFVNQNVSSMGLQVADIDIQFSDGVILLLLIGQLEGFFVPLGDFHLTPVNHSEMVHNVTLACDFLLDSGLNIPNIDPQEYLPVWVKEMCRSRVQKVEERKGAGRTDSPSPVLGGDEEDLGAFDIISRDASATLKVLYALFKRHKGRQKPVASTQN